MILTGNPPQSLYASQSIGLEVILEWGRGAFEVVEHNIYRKQYAPDPYEPLATITADWDMVFTDLTALPMIEYYYVVTNVFEGGY